MFIHTPSASIFSAPPSPPPVFPSLLPSLFSPASTVSPMPTVFTVRSQPPVYFNHPMSPNTDNFTFSQQSSSFSTFKTTTPAGDKLKREVTNGGEPVWTKNKQAVTNPAEIAKLEALHRNTLARQSLNFPLIPQYTVDRFANTLNRTLNRAASIVNGALQRFEYANPPRRIISGPLWRVTIF